jgi:hypothetical protein
MNHQRPLSRTLRFVLLTAFCLLLTAVAAHAQSATATLSGTIADTNGASIPGVQVTIENTGTTLKRQTSTNDEGSFTLPLLPPGKYVVTARRNGFAPVQINDVVLNVGDQKTLRIELKAGDVKAEVQVVNEAPLINESPAVGTVVDRQFVENLPLNGRSFQSLISLTPGVVITPTTNGGQFSVNGQRASANAFMVDGVSANFGAVPNALPSAHTSGNLPGLTTSGTTQSLVSVDALEQFGVQTSTYSAAYGRQPGGQISIVTRSGTNDFHGSVFDYVRNDAFDANDWFANRAGQPKPPERQHDFGGTLGGPIQLPRFGEGGRQPGYNGRNRTFFFFSYEGLRLRLPRFALTNVPTLALRQTAPAGLRPILNAFSLPNGRDLGNGMAEFTATFSDPSNLNATSLRIDHTVNSKLTIFGRYNKAPSENITRSGTNLSLVTANRLRTQTITLGATASLTSSDHNEFRANYSDNAALARTTLSGFGGASPLDKHVVIPVEYDSRTANSRVLFSFPGLTAGSPDVTIYSGDFLSSQRQFNIVDNFTYRVRNHELKFGIDYRRLTPVFAFNSYSLVAFFTSLQQVLNSSTSNGSVQVFSEAKPIYVNFSAYGQDTWKLSRRLTLDLGLRWEVNPAPSEATGNHPLAITSIDNLATVQLAARGTPLWKTTYNNFAPRVGVAYQVSQKAGRETVVRGGFGVYYDSGNDQASTAFVGFPFLAGRSTTVTYPLVAAQVAPPSLPTLTPPFPFMTVFDPALKLPYTLQWNLASEHSLGKSQSVTVSYVGAAGRRLLQQRVQSLGSINPSFTFLTLATNKATSDYHALQAQFQRRLSRGLQALASYTWSHAIDEDSQSNNTVAPQRGNAIFDVRHNFAAAVTYDIPAPSMNGVVDVVLSHWSIDSSVRARSPLPVDVIATSVFNPVDATLVALRPNQILGVPLYINDPSVPGGRRLNRAAFSNPPAGQQGTLGRNVFRGLPSWQVDLALRREFALVERLRLQFRAEAFNVFNHPNFGTIQTFLPAANFGQATNMLNRQLGGVNQLYQIGGPRSFQFALKVLF